VVDEEREGREIHKTEVKVTTVPTREESDGIEGVEGVEGAGERHLGYRTLQILYGATALH
jgi:hypothetical protein